MNKDKRLLEIATKMSVLGHSLRKEELTDAERSTKTAELAELNSEYNKELKKNIRRFNKVGVYTPTKTKK